MLMLQLRGLGALVRPGAAAYSIHTDVEPSEVRLLWMGLETKQDKHLNTKTF